MSFLATIFDRDVFSKDQAKEHGNPIMRKVRVGTHHFNISTQILDLLWFGDGKRKNTEDFEDSEISEPSEIMIRDQVYREDPVNVGNFPAFHNFTPGQKYEFLSWLEDIDRTADIGYAYLLLYSLERHIYMGDRVEPAVDLVSTLHAKIDHAEFVRHSSNTLLWAAYKYKRVDFLNCLRKDEIPASTQAIVKLFTHGSLSARDIMLISKDMGMDNQRYVTGKPKLFEKILSDKLFEKYRENSFSINQVAQAGKNTLNIFLSNYSIPKADRRIQVPDFINNKEVKKPLLKLLEETSEEVKLELAGHYQ